MKKNTLFLIINIINLFLYLSFYFFDIHAEGQSKVKIFIIILFFINIFYFINFFIIKNSDINIKHIIIFALIINYSLLFLCPPSTNDMKTYVQTGRIISHHKENPYIKNFSSFQHDILYEDIKSNWSEKKTIYAPLFLYFASSVTYISQDNYLFSVYLFKFIFTSMFLAIVFLFYKMTKNTKLTYLLTFNPLLIFEFSLNAHNDILSLFLSFIGLFCLFKNKHLFAWIFFILSAFVKFFTIILLPFYLLYSMNKKDNIKKKIMHLLISLILFFIFTILLFHKFYTGSAIFEEVLSIGTGKNGAMAPMLVTIYSFCVLFINTDDKFLMAFIISLLIFSSVYIFLLLKSYLFPEFKQEKLIKYHFILFFVLFFITLTWVVSWYYAYIIIFYIFYLHYKKELLKKDLFILFFFSFFPIINYLTFGF